MEMEKINGAIMCIPREQNGLISLDMPVSCEVCQCKMYVQDPYVKLCKENDMHYMCTECAAKGRSL